MSKKDIEDTHGIKIKQVTDEESGFARNVRVLEPDQMKSLYESVNKMVSPE